MLTDRLTEVETKLAFLEDTVQTLNTVVCQQQKQIDQLEATVKMLIDRCRQLSAADNNKPRHEIPPHY